MGGAGEVRDDFGGVRVEDQRLESCQQKEGIAKTPGTQAPAKARTQKGSLESRKSSTAGKQRVLRTPMGDWQEIQSVELWLNLTDLVSVLAETSETSETRLEIARAVWNADRH